MASNSDQVVTEFATMKRELKGIERMLATGQLGNSSLGDGEAIQMIDGQGVLRGLLGAHSDGSFGVSGGNNLTPPPAPNPPVVESVLGGIRVTSTGLQGTAPVDFSHYNVYVSTDPLLDFELVGNDNEDAKILGLVGDIAVITGITYTEHFVWLTAENNSGSESPPAGPASATPVQAVGADILDGVITDLKLADAAVTAAKIAAGAVTTVAIGDQTVDVTKLADGSVTGAKIVANAIAAGHIAANAIQANAIAAGQVQAIHIAAEAIDASKIVSAAITADKIAANAVTSDKVAANAITAGKITAGAITAEKIQAGIIISEATLQTGLAGKRVVISAPGNEIRFYPAADDSRYARMYSYIPADFPNDISVEIRAINSNVSSVVSKMYLNPDHAFLGLTNAVDDSLNGGGCVELLSDLAFIGCKDAVGNAFGLITLSNGAYLLQGASLAGTFSSLDGLVIYTNFFASSGSALNFTLFYGPTMASPMTPMVNVSNGSTSTECKWWLVNEGTTGITVRWTDTGNPHGLYVASFRRQ